MNVWNKKDPSTVTEEQAKQSEMEVIKVAQRFKNNEEGKDKQDDQSWYWTERWQKAEKKADEDVLAGRMKSYDSVDDLIDDLNRKDSEGE